MSFRIDSSLRTLLEEEAEKSGVTLNALVSQILTRYMSWGRYAERLKLLPVSKDILRDLLEPMEKEKLAETARRGAETSGREHILFLFQEINQDSVLRFLDIWRSHFDASQHRYDGRRHYFTIHHDVNLNFSLFTKEYLSAMIQNTIPRNVLFETVSPNSVTFSFEC